MSRRGRVVSIVAGAALVGQIPRLGTLAPMLVGGLLVVAIVGTIWWHRWLPSRGAVSHRWMIGPLIGAWLLVTLLSTHKFAHRGYTDGGPTLNLESLLHILVYAAVGLLALGVVRILESSLDRSHPPVVLMLLPCWTCVSLLWSPTPFYALVRGALLLTVGLLAWATVALGRADVDALRAVVEGFLRWYVRVVLVLAGLGIAFGPLYVSAKEANLSRFTWLGAHPLASGFLLSIAAVIVATTPARVLKVPTWGRAAMGLALLAALVDNQTRVVWITLAIVLVGGLVLSHIGSMTRWVGAPLVGAGAAAALLYRGPQLWAYILRDDDADRLATGNGRRELWGIGFRALETPFDWAFGLGHGITRTVFIEEAPWARTAHSSVLAVIVSLGLVGLVLFLALVGSVVRDLILGRMWETSSTGFTLVLLFAAVLIHGLTADGLVIPNAAHSLLYLVAAVAILDRTARVRATPHPLSAPRTADLDRQQAG